MPLWDDLTLTRTDIPESDFSIFSTTGEPSFVRAEVDCSDPVFMTFECPQTMTCAGGPEAYRLIFSTTGKQRTIRAEDDDACSVRTIL